jgi:phosphoglycerate dehydrogenase-like enzyme
MHVIPTLFLTSTHFCPNQAELTKLKTEFPQLQLNIVQGSNYTREQLQEAQIIVGNPKAEDLKYATNLRWLQTASSGVGPYTELDVYARKTVFLTNAKGTYGRQIADHVLGTIIAYNHLFFTYYEQMKSKQWKSYFPSSDLFDSTILIIGFGDIGKNVAIRAKAHEMRTVVIKRTESEKPSYVDEMATMDKLDSFLPEADYVVLCAASTDQTKHIINSQRIASLKNSAYIVNVGRGSLIDEQALIEALENKVIGGAALDVTEEEPLSPTSKLYSLPNVFITPHSSGLSDTDPRQVFSLFFENLGRYLQSKEMVNLVDFQRKY